MPVDSRRVDLVRVSDRSYAYEVKTEFDNLDKMAKQVGDYAKVFEYLTVVLHPRHLDGVSVHKIKATVHQIKATDHAIRATWIEQEPGDCRAPGTELCCGEAMTWLGPNWITAEHPYVSLEVEAVLCSLSAVSCDNAHS